MIFIFFYNRQWSSKCESAIPEETATLDADPNSNIGVGHIANAHVRNQISTDPMADLATISTKADVIMVEFYSMTVGLVLYEGGR